MLGICQLTLFVLIYAYFRKISAARRTLENPSSWSWEELPGCLSDIFILSWISSLPFPPYLLSLAVWYQWKLILKHFLEMERDVIHFSNNMFIDCPQEKINALKTKCIISNRSTALVLGLQDAAEIQKYQLEDLPMQSLTKEYCLGSVGSITEEFPSHLV